MIKLNKYLYLWVVQGYYTGLYGWEDLAESDDYKDSLTTLKEYNENETIYQHRMIQRRALNPAWERMQNVNN